MSEFLSDIFLKLQHLYNGIDEAGPDFRAEKGSKIKEFGGEVFFRREFPTPN